MSAASPLPPPRCRHLGLQDYEQSWHAMHAFTDARSAQTPDEFWFLQHPPVYTLGRNGRREHILDAGDIPVVACDRGGQVTYHGPGQLVVYTLIDLKRLGLGVRELVTALEQSVIRLLADYGIEAAARADAPGVYVNHAKIAALGLRIRRGCSFHGLSLNIDMEMAPFRRIDPCGYPDLEVVQLRQLLQNNDQDIDIDMVTGKLQDILLETIYS